MRMYDLAGADPARRFSPYCWRTKMALAMKGLPVETIAWRFTEKQVLGALGCDKVPVLVDGDRVVTDSWAIAEYLEETYPDRPSLFGGPGGHALARFINAWTDAVLHAGLVRMVVADIAKVLAPEDAGYFRQSREARFGMPLEAVQADREAKLEGFRQSLHPLRMVLRTQPFLGGAAPLYADAIVFGGFQWARCVSPFRLLAADDQVEAWRQRMLDLHGGLARAAIGFD
nr:glutathione S-transferase family protein [Falsiroseomonas frigidaquae]